MRRALFLDRDGVINVDYGYIGRIEDFVVIDGVFDALRAASDWGYSLIVVTNQSGIARGYFTLAEYLALEAHMRAIFVNEGIDFTGIYYCPHHPEGKVAEFAMTCECRKPLPGMLLRAAEAHAIDLAGSLLVGDKDSDIAAAHAAGIGQAYKLQYPEATLVNFVRNVQNGSLIL